MRSIGEKHDVILTLDEIGALLTLAEKGNQNKAGIINYILRMYTKSDRISNKRAKAKQKGEDEEEPLYAPHFFISAASTPESLLEGLSVKKVSENCIFWCKELF